MQTFWKAAVIVLALGAAAAIPARAQPYEDPYYGDDAGPPADSYYDDGGYYQGTYGDGAYGDGYYDSDAYDDPYADAEYGADAYGYCDEYGCPGDYWNLPVYYGPVFYDDAWFNGPLYYRDWGGRRQYWIHGGWRYDGWRGARPNWYREGRYGPALGLNWYRSNHVFRQGWHGNGARQGYGRRGYQVYRAPSYGAPNRFSTPSGNRFQTGRPWNSGRDPGSSFGYRRNFQAGNPGNSGLRSFGGNGGRNWGGGGRGSHSQFSQRPASSGFQARSSAAGQSFGGGRNWGSGRFGGGHDGGGGRHH
ncbi:MAG: hypothetical protein BGN85_12260 [Alphaproteobacteria bacterium 64-11]|nr:hypothetical protein [Alphaproteobacteria bacterium]OJU08289.1 MAG: hypothetical protein BGN85_12260 [Alphaproteobacteria bacterium 64-11]